MPRLPGFEWLDDQAGQDVGTALEGQFPGPGGAPGCTPMSGGPRLPPRGPEAALAVLARMIFPPRIEKLAQSQDFSVTDYAMILPAGVGSTITSAALRFQVPQGQIGWLQEWDLYALTPTAGLSAQWTIRINGAPVPGFDTKQNPPGTAFFYLIGDDEMRIRLPNNCVLDLLITNLNANGPWTVGGDLAGWYHPESAEARAWNLNL